MSHPPILALLLAGALALARWGGRLPAPALPAFLALAAAALAAARGGAAAEAWVLQAAAASLALACYEPCSARRAGALLVASVGLALCAGAEQLLPLLAGLALASAGWLVAAPPTRPLQLLAALAPPLLLALGAALLLLAAPGGGLSCPAPAGSGQPGRLLLAAALALGCGAGGWAALAASGGAREASPALLAWSCAALPAASATLGGRVLAGVAGLSAQVSPAGELPAVLAWLGLGAAAWAWLGLWRVATLEQAWRRLAGAQAGLVLVALSASARGETGALAALVAGLVPLQLAGAGLLALLRARWGDTRVERVVGLAGDNPGWAALLALVLAGQAGLPGTPAFAPRLLLLGAALREGPLLPALGLFLLAILPATWAVGLLRVAAARPRRAAGGGGARLEPSRVASGPTALAGGLGLLTALAGLGLTPGQAVGGGAP